VAKDRLVVFLPTDGYKTAQLPTEQISHNGIFRKQAKHTTTAQEGMHATCLEANSFK